MQVGAAKGICNSCSENGCIPVYLMFLLAQEIMSPLLNVQSLLIFV